MSFVTKIRADYLKKGHIIPALYESSEIALMRLIHFFIFSRPPQPGSKKNQTQEQEEEEKQAIATFLKAWETVEATWRPEKYHRCTKTATKHFAQIAKSLRLNFNKDDAKSQSAAVLLALHFVSLK
jgi:hypothetical protein